MSTSRRAPALAVGLAVLLFMPAAAAAGAPPPSFCERKPDHKHCQPAPEPTPEPIVEPTPEPTQEPTPEPTVEPTPEPSEEPTPTPEPTVEPTQEPTPEPMGPAACTDPVWSSSNHLATWHTNGYLVNNNMWSGDAGPQTIYACSWNSWYVISNQPGTGTDDGVKTYPDTQKHVSLPVSSLPPIVSTFDVTVPPGGGAVVPNSKQWNAAYDLWLDNWATEVMVWTTWTMNWQYWYGVYNGEQVAFDGVAYHAYTNGKGLWFIRDDVTDKGSVDLASILQWAVQRGWLRPNAVLQEIEYGFEVSYTGEPTKFSLNDYTLSIGP